MVVKSHYEGVCYAGQPVDANSPNGAHVHGDLPMFRRPHSDNPGEACGSRSSE